MVDLIREILRDSTQLFFGNHAAEALHDTGDLRYRGFRSRSFTGSCRSLHFSSRARHSNSSIPRLAGSAAQLGTSGKSAEPRRRQAHCKETNLLENRPDRWRRAGGKVRNASGPGEPEPAEDGEPGDGDAGPMPELDVILRAFLHPPEFELFHAWLRVLSRGAPHTTPNVRNGIDKSIPAGMLAVKVRNASSVGSHSSGLRHPEASGPEVPL